MNLQLDQLLSVPSKREEQLFDEITDLFIGAQHAAMVIQQQIASAELLCAVYNHVRKYGITEENRDLFAMSFESAGYDYSEENVLANAYHSVKNVIERIIKFLKEKVQVFFKKIKEWYRSIFKKKLQDASKQPLTKEQEAEFNKRMTASTGSSNEGVADASFKDLASIAQLVKEGKYIYVDNVIKALTAVIDVLKQSISSIRNNKPISVPEDVNIQKQFGTPAEAGWADPVKIGKLMDAVNQVSDMYDDLLMEAYQLQKKINKQEITLGEDLMKSLGGPLDDSLNVMIAIRFTGRTAKKAMEIRESILKGEVD